MLATSADPIEPPSPSESGVDGRAVVLVSLEEHFRAVYAESLSMVWRSLRGLGVHDASLEDAVQDVFLVVHRRLSTFEARSTFRTWLYGIVLHVARNHRRRERRKGGCASLEDETIHDVADGRPSPLDEVAANQALLHLNHLLDALDEAKREVFVLAELEEMSAPEIAETLGVNVNTVYSRLRAARSALEIARRRIEGKR